MTTIHVAPCPCCSQTDQLGEAHKSLQSMSELVGKLDAGVGRVVRALGFAPGGADFDAMIARIGEMQRELLAFRERGAPGAIDAPEFRTNLLEAANLTKEIGVGASDIFKRLERKRGMIAKLNTKRRHSAVVRLIYLIEIVGLEALHSALSGGSDQPASRSEDQGKVDAFVGDSQRAKRDDCVPAVPDAVELTKGLLDALVLTPWGPPSLAALFAGERPEVTHVEVTVKGLPGFRATVKTAACRELQVALEALLGPRRPEELVFMTPLGLRTADDLIDRIVEVLRLIEEAESSRPIRPAVLCAKLREILGSPQ